MNARRFEKNGNALHKEAKAYLDSVRNVSASSTRIATTIDLFFGTDSGEQAISANAYKRAVEELEGDVALQIVRNLSAVTRSKSHSDVLQSCRMRRTARQSWSRSASCALTCPK